MKARQLKQENDNLAEQLRQLQQKFDQLQASVNVSPMDTAMQPTVNPDVHPNVHEQPTISEFLSTGIIPEENVDLESLLQAQSEIEALI